MMSKISLLTIFLLVMYVEANNCTPSGCDAYAVSSCNSSAGALSISFGEVTVSGCQGNHEKSNFANPISIQVDFSSPDNKNYTAVMVDPDAPGHGEGQVWLHWIIANIPGESLKTSVDVTNWSPTIKAYHPPTPPDCDHRYFFLLYAELESSNMNLSDPGKRGKFDVDGFKTSENLCGPVAVSSFVTKP